MDIKSAPARGNRNVRLGASNLAFRNADHDTTVEVGAGSSDRKAPAQSKGHNAPDPKTIVGEMQMLVGETMSLADKPDAARALRRLLRQIDDLEYVVTPGDPKAIGATVLAIAELDSWRSSDAIALAMAIRVSLALTCLTGLIQTGLPLEQACDDDAPAFIDPDVIRRGLGIHGTLTVGEAGRLLKSNHRRLRCSAAGRPSTQTKQ